jgi:V/A-type H+-transporting ATPase subunit I
MIEGIKKYTFLVHHSDYSGLLDALYTAGVVHIVEKRKLDENSSAAIEMKSMKRYREALRKISDLEKNAIPAANSAEPEEALEEFDSFIKEIEESGHQMGILKNEAEKSRPWGDYDISKIQKLIESGWNISLFSCPEKSFEQKWKVNHALEVISRKRGRFYFAVVHKDEDLTDIRAEEVKIPGRTANNIIEELESIEKRIEEIKSAIKLKAPGWIASLNKGIEDIISRFEYSEAAEQADKYAEDSLYVLEGWVPVSEEKKIEELLKKTDCYSFSSYPAPEEKIPVILRNNKFSSLFEPISKLFALPNYRELDLTPFFAPFFMLFFGFCLGDAGYGLIFIIAGFFIKRKIDKKYRSIITLGQYFGVAAVIMGLLSGTLFGINLIDTGYTITEHSIVEMKNHGLPGNTLLALNQVKDVKFESRQNFVDGISDIIGEDNYSKYKGIILRNAESDFPVLNSVRHFMLDSINMFYLALLLGALQIIFGMILKIVNITKLKGFKYSLSTIGWVILIITLVIFMGGGELNLIDKMKLRPLFIGLEAAAVILIFFFNSPGKNIFVRVGLGIWDSYGIITGVFGDLLSYIRLFALGISSSILGFVFNEISLQTLSVPYIGWLLFVLLLLVGHTLNIAIATLGSFVHPMRLTFVEFYKNAGFNGGGIEYKPFKIKKYKTIKQ